MSTNPLTPAAPNKVRHVVIHIDKQAFKVSGPTITAEELRALPTPPIGADRDLYLEVPGSGEDELIVAREVVTVSEGEPFFTAPSTITPGHAA